MWGWVALAVFIVFIITLYLLSPLISPPTLKLQGAHVLVTGGSSGIGKALAIQAAKQGARVTLVARNKDKLKEAKREITACVASPDKSQQVQVISVDLSSDYHAVEKALHHAEETLGAVDFLINCAGTSVAGRFEDLPVSEFKRMIEMNYLSAVYATRAIISAMKARGRGRIVFVSSQAGQIGLFGFTAYSASKFALRGIAEALQMEVKPYNICLTLAFPPDTDTPGYQEEQKNKPLETKLISETSGLFTADNVANIILSDAMIEKKTLKVIAINPLTTTLFNPIYLLDTTDFKVGKFFSSVGLDGMMLSNLTCGFSPVTSLMEATQQVATMGFFKVISLFYLAHFERIVHRCKLQRDSQATSKKLS